MAGTKSRIGEVDVVSLVEEVDGWPAGTIGTVVADFGNDKMVEISNDHGVMLGLPVVSVDKLKLEAKYPL